MDAKNILLPREVDELLRYPRGRSLKLAKAGKIPFITLPDGEIRFDESEVARLLDPHFAVADREVAHA
jgi:predicted site-specific integrase-resolvase